MLLNITPESKYIEPPQVTAVVQEAAQKVVELQRQLTTVRARLKQKEKIQTENERLQSELEELKVKFTESQKRQT